MFVAAKSDLPRVKQVCVCVCVCVCVSYIFSMFMQSYNQSPVEFCNEQGLPHPYDVSASSSNQLIAEGVFNKIAMVANDP